ncbi:MAG TPA: LacI family DNA-binding transcriptional regulator [Candidatus Acidoferrum sp.]|nr:LacI family DNA-binding transcriptional regulator [Candidatus Acidoferrum sp.]
MPYRIRDVAKQAGVSKSTVSRVLNDSTLVDADTRKRVLEAARKLNYYRDASAQRLARGGRSDFFGLLISDVENPVFPEMIKSFETSAAAKDYNLFLCATNYDPHRTEAAVRKMIENGVRGVAIMTSSATEATALELAARQIAVVVVDLESTRRSISSITIDYSGGVREAADHLAQLGHQRATFIAGPDERRSARRYRETVIKILHERNLGVEQIVECDQTLEGGRAAIWKILSDGTPPTAIICINDLAAIGAMTALREMGVRVPGQVSVIGCEDIYMARFVNPPLTTVKLDRKCLGKMAFEILEKASLSKKSLPTKATLQTHLIVRGSTAASASQTFAWPPTNS